MNCWNEIKKIYLFYWMEGMKWIVELLMARFIEIQWISYCAVVGYGWLPHQLKHSFLFLPFLLHWFPSISLLQQTKVSWTARLSSLYKSTKKGKAAEAERRLVFLERNGAAAEEPPAHNQPKDNSIKRHELIGFTFIPPINSFDLISFLSLCWRKDK